MKRIILAVTIAGLVGCGLDTPVPEQTGTPAAGEAPAEAAIEQAKPVGQAEAADPIETFSERLAADGRGHFRFDRIRGARDGGRERQVFVEMLGPADAQAADAAAEALDALGFEPGRRWGDENGIRLAYKDPQGKPLRVLVRSRDAHPKLQRDDATSSVYLTQPVE